MAPLLALKMEAAEELGLTGKLKESGWGGLSAAEAGRVGAYITRVLRERAAQEGGGADVPAGSPAPAEG